MHHYQTVNYPKILLFTNGFPKGEDEVPSCLKNGGLFETSQLNNGGFGCI
jgi:hypothetical protein